jgi:hypothetical protein
MINSPRRLVNAYTNAIPIACIDLNQGAKTLVPTLEEAQGDRHKRNLLRKQHMGIGRGRRRTIRS